MNDLHLSYAMRNEAAVQSLLWFNDPTQLKHWTMPWVESLVVLGALLSLWHAWRWSAQAERRAHLWTWVATVCYGLMIEVVSYNHVDNFWHGEFSVMFYYNHLPLYIVALYPAIMYPTLVWVRGLGLAQRRGGRWLEMCCAGLAAQAFYAPFDNMGPMLHWWVWDPQAPSLQPFLRSVPATSYLWVATLNMAFVVLARRWIWDAAGQRPQAVQGLRGLGRAVAVGGATLVGSIAMQLPVTLLSQGVQWPEAGGWLVALLVLCNAGMYLWAAPARPTPLPGVLLAFVLLWWGFFVGLYLGFGADILDRDALGVGALGTPVGHVGVAVVALAVLCWVHLRPPVLARGQAGHPRG